MGCKHERLRTVGDRVFCCKCNEELSIEFLMGNSGENRANNPAPEAKENKPKARKRTAKKAV
jgi:hypothetical protein